MAERPGTWHTHPEAGPQNIDWNPHARVPRITSVTAHEEGIKAASWLLERLENGNDDRRGLLIEWIKLLLQRPSLVDSLDLCEILMRRTHDNSIEIPVKIILCLAKVIDYNREIGHELCKRLMMRPEIEIRRSMADVLTRLFRRLEEDALPFFEQLLKDEDQSVLAAVSSTVGDLKFIDEELWANKMEELSKHKLPIVRRNLVSSIRAYVEIFPDDSRKILPLLWQDGDEVVRTRMRELLIRMEEISPQHFADRIVDLQHNNCSLDALWDNFQIRRPEREKLWKKWLSQGGEIPVSIVRKEHQSNMQAPNELPDVGNALKILDYELDDFD